MTERTADKDRGVRLSVRMSDQEYSELRKLSARYNISTSQVVREAITAMTAACGTWNPENQEGVES